MENKGTTYAFIDASNLFYGGEKSLGWKIDYEKLLLYLKERYQVSRAFYFGGVETYGFVHNYLDNDSVPLNELKDYLEEMSQFVTENFNIVKYLKRAKFYLKLQEFGYEVHLKPVKTYTNEDGSVTKKANCDVEMTFYLMKEKDNFDRAIVLSGDGDFLPVLKYLKDIGKDVIILARGQRTAKEIKQFAGGNFRDFVRLEKYIKLEK
jgi:uncharacterized LabA/DUF88 family protein